MNNFSSRIVRIQEKMKQQDIDAVYVRSLSNILWATMFYGVFDSEPAHALLVLPDRVLLHSDSRYGSALKNAAKESGIEITIERKQHFDLLLKAVKQSRSLDADDGRTITVGIEDSISLKEYRVLETRISRSDLSIRLVELSGFIEELRETKDGEEVQLMKKAQQITDQAFSYIVSYIQPGMTERHIQQELENTMFSLGAEGLAFSSIVASGSRAAMPHSIPGDTAIQVGECIVMDFGAKYRGYCSDMTRTVFVGKPNERMQKAWEALVEANESCENLIRKGVIASCVHQNAEDVLAKHGFASTMGHSLGHSVGIDIHEAPNLSPLNDRPLEVGNVVTVEPGIYLDDDFGMRLEDFGVVTEDGFEVITQSTHEMVIIEPRDNVIQKTTEE